MKPFALSLDREHENPFAESGFYFMFVDLQQS